MQITVRGISSEVVDRIRNGGEDANGQPALSRVAEGPGEPLPPLSRAYHGGRGKAGARVPTLRFSSAVCRVWSNFSYTRRHAKSTMSWRCRLGSNFLDPAIIRGYGGRRLDSVRHGKRCAGGRDLAEVCRNLLS